VWLRGAAAIAIDASGDAYVAGIMQSRGFATVNAAETAPGAGFLFKLDPTGEHLVYFSYLDDANTAVFAVMADGSGDAGSAETPAALR
jgi:hypothetical protein